MGFYKATITIYSESEMDANSVAFLLAEHFDEELATEGCAPCVTWADPIQPGSPEEAEASRYVEERA